MYRNLMWCYVFVLTLLDLSLNSKLTAQGKSHGVTVHESLVEGITFQEWGSESGAGGGLAAGRALPPAALRASPPALALGRAALGAAHAATVTLTNTANTTMHLASIAGTTPDFHASFFDSKTLACGANTSFSVVFLGRREGPVAQHLYIHTSLGVLKYPVSAVGVASEWALWPLVGVRAPLNATLAPLLTMHNPTDRTVQVTEMYSSASWLGLQLPDGGASAPRAHWQLPPRTTRALVRLRLQARHSDTTAYIRIKANATGPPLVVVVQAAPAPAGAHAEPLQLRAGTRGAADSPYTFSIALGNSDAAALPLAGAAAGACRPAPHAPPPPAHANGAAHNGAGPDGVQLALLRPQLEPRQPPQPAASLTLDFAKLWAAGTDEAEAEAEAEERFCAGWAGLAGAALPYSVRLVPGTLRLPSELHFVTAEAASTRAAEVRVRNEFRQPVRLVAVEPAPELADHFEIETWGGLSLAPGASGLAARLRLRRREPAALLDARLVLRTNLTHTAYTVPVRLYSGHLHIEWQWPGADAATLPLGALATSSTRRVLARVHNPAPAPVCATAHAALPGATLALQADGGCVPARGWAPAVLTVVAPARAGPVAGAVWLAAGARAETRVTLAALPGAVRARLVHDHTPDHEPRDRQAAPWASGWAPALVVESTMALRMRLLRVEATPPDPALVFIPPDEPEAWWFGAGTHSLGLVRYLPELACGDACYTGRALPAPGEWLRAPLRQELALLARRRALYERERASPVRNVTLAVDTSEMVRIPVSGWVRVGWPRLVRDAGAGRAGLAGVGAASARWLRVRNPAHHPLALHALLQERLLDPPLLVETGECANESCVYVPGVFTVAEWRAVRGGAGLLRGEDGGQLPGEGEGPVPPLLLAPHAEVELRIDFLPPAAMLYTAVLYLRNNLTIVEALQLGGRGAVPRFELGGRRGAGHAPILLQVAECPEGQECAEGWRARRTLLARNTGAVPLRLRAWRLAGEPCAARGFRLEPCAPLHLQPNESRALTVTFHADCSLARVACPLTLRAESGAAAFRLLGAVPARLLPACTRAQPRPAWEPALRAAGSLLAVLALALVLAAAALDAERLLRRARAGAARAPAPRAAPLDLRALARDPPAATPAAAAPAPAARRRRPRRAPPAPDPKAERRAFDRWRAEMLRRDEPRAEDESSRSSEEAGAEPAAPPPPPPRPPSSDTEPESEPRGDSDASSGTEPEPARAPRSPSPSPSPPRAPRSPSPSPSPPRAPDAPRPRREPGEPARRADPAPRARPPPGKHHARKDKVSKRRGERPAAPARVSPPAAEPRAAAGAGAGAGAAPALRWGASWSSVVAAGAPPAPAAAPAPPPAAGDARRDPPAPRPTVAPRPAPDHSLFYFNDAAHSLRAAPAPAPAPAPRDEFAWRVPPPDRSPFDPRPHDYRVAEEPHGLAGSNAYGTIGSGWSGASPWAGAPLRPPPGFGPRAPAPATAAPAPAPAPPPVRAFDPFHSLASIWAPAAFDWRAEPRERRDH